MVKIAPPTRRKQRTITITLTEPQFKALGGAVGHWWTDFEGDEGMSQFDVARGRALNNAWNKIKAAWYK